MFGAKSRFFNKKSVAKSDVNDDTFAFAHSVSAIIKPVDGIALKEKLVLKQQLKEHKS